MYWTHGCWCLFVLLFVALAFNRLVECSSLFSLRLSGWFYDNKHLFMKCVFTWLLKFFKKKHKRCDLWFPQLLVHVNWDNSAITTVEILLFLNSVILLFSKGLNINFSSSVVRFLFFFPVMNLQAFDFTLSTLYLYLNHKKHHHYVDYWAFNQY